MNTFELWQQAMRPYAGDVPCMDDLEVYRLWVAEIREEKCPFCGEKVITRKAIVCGNSGCVFKTVTYGVLMKYGQEAG